MSIGQGLGIGMLITMIATVISSIFSYIYMKFIDDSMMAKIVDAQVAEMEKRGLDDASIEQAMEISSKFMTVEMIQVWAILGMGIIGFIIVLIVSLFTKKANPALDV